MLRQYFPGRGFQSSRRHRRRFSRRSGAVFAPAAGIALGIQWLKTRNQMLFAVANQISMAHGFERIAQQRPVVRVVVAQKRFV